MSIPALLLAPAPSSLLSAEAEDPAQDPKQEQGIPGLGNAAFTLLTLREAKGGGVSVRSLIISTSDTYWRLTSRMSAWLGFPLDEGHSGGGEVKEYKSTWTQPQA